MRKIPRRDVKNAVCDFLFLVFIFRSFFLSFSSAGIAQCFFMTNVWNVMPLATVSECAWMFLYVWELSGASKLSRKIVTWKHINKTHKHTLTQPHAHKLEPNEKTGMIERACACLCVREPCVPVCMYAGRALGGRAYMCALTHRPRTTYVCVCADCFTRKFPWLWLPDGWLTVRLATNRVLFFLLRLLGDQQNMRSRIKLHAVICCSHVQTLIRKIGSVNI